MRGSEEQKGQQTWCSYVGSWLGVPHLDPYHLSIGVLQLHYIYIVEDCGSTNLCLYVF